MDVVINKQNLSTSDRKYFFFYQFMNIALSKVAIYVKMKRKKWCNNGGDFNLHNQLSYAWIQGCCWFKVLQLNMDNFYGSSISKNVW